MNTLIKLLKQLAFQMPTPVELAQTELVEAQRKLLQAQSAQDWAKSEVTYNQERIKRLQAFVNAQATSA